MDSGVAEKEVESLESFQISKPSPKLNKVIEWLQNNPDQAGLSNRVIADLIGGVSHTLVKQAKERM